MVKINKAVDDKTVDLLSTWYRSASRKIVSEINSSTEFNQARKLSVLRQTDKILQDLSKKTKRWNYSQIEKAYRNGSQLSFDMLSSIGLVDKYKFSLIDEEAIKAIADETYLNFGESFRGVVNSVDRLFTKAIKESIQARIAEGKITGETRKKISEMIANELKDGFVGMRDKSGKVWDIEVYSRMLARTKILEATNMGMANEMLKNGYDLVIVSDHNSDHDACHKYEGKILSLTGKDERYPSLEKAKEDGLFHPNCEHRYYAYHEDYASVSEKWSKQKEL